MFPRSQPPASPSTQEAIQGMLSMANLQSSESCLQTSWGTNQAKNNSISTQNSKKTGGGSNKNAGKRLLKKSTKNSIDIEDYDEDQDHLDACFKDSDYGKYKQSSLSMRLGMHVRICARLQIPPMFLMIHLLTFCHIEIDWVFW